MYSDIYRNFHEVITIQVQVYSFLENLIFGNDSAVNLIGGMNNNYSPTTKLLLRIILALQRFK